MQPSQDYSNIVSILEGIKGEVGTTGQYGWYFDDIGVATFGYGHALVDTQGSHIRQGEADVQPRADAAVRALTGGFLTTTLSGVRALKRNDLSLFSVHVDPLLRADTTQCQYDALVDFSYNLGIGALKGSTLLSFHNNRMNAGKPDITAMMADSKAKRLNNIADAFGAWSNADHQWSLGVFHRRAFEFLMYYGLDYPTAYSTAWATRG